MVYSILEFYPWKLQILAFLRFDLFGKFTFGDFGNGITVCLFAQTTVLFAPKIMAYFCLTLQVDSSLPSCTCLHASSGQMVSGTEKMDNFLVLNRRGSITFLFGFAKSKQFFAGNPDFWGQLWISSWSGPKARSAGLWNFVEFLTGYPAF